MPLINLHNHSARSDGTLAPEALAHEAAKAGIEYFSLTDHDTMDGWGEMAPALRAQRIKYCYGVELTTCPHDYLHILGYGTKPADAGLLALLAGLRKRKISRIKQTLTLLKTCGFEISYEDLPWRGGCPPETYQVAQLLVERNFAPTLQQAFGQYLTQGKPAYLARTGLTVEGAIQAIIAAGGKPVLAHPYTIKAALNLPAWKDCGLAGIEAYYPAHTAAATREYLAVARRYGLFVTAGADYHGPGTNRDTMAGFNYSEAQLLELSGLFTAA